MIPTTTITAAQFCQAVTRLPKVREESKIDGALRWICWLGIAGAAALMGCNGLPPPLPPCPPLCLTPLPWTPTPTSPPGKPTEVATARPTLTAVPTLAPAPVPFQTTEGRTTIILSGLDVLPLAPNRDNLILTTLTWETQGLDRTVPVLELALRGNTPEPCLSRAPQVGCRKLAGLVARYSSNLAYDSTLPWDEEHEAESQAKACGAGVNYHARLALGAYGPGGTLRVDVIWTPDQITVRTPVDSWTLRPRVAGSIGMGRVITGAPWPRQTARSWLWQDFSAGAGLATVDWQGTSGVRTVCP